MVMCVSAGVLCAPFTFLGPDYGPQLRDVYTTMHMNNLTRQGGGSLRAEFQESDDYATKDQGSAAVDGLLTIENSENWNYWKIGACRIASRQGESVLYDAAIVDGRDVGP